MVLDVRLENYAGLLECLRFHGHLCPGLSLGYKASILAISALNEARAEDEEIVAIVENDSCFADAVQVITGCTFGKGNFIFQDHGKMVLTLLSRKNMEGVRVALRYGAIPGHDDLRAFTLMEKVFMGEATSEEKRIFGEIQLQRAKIILEMDAGEIFSLEKVRIDLPPYARIVKSEACEVCGEPVMVSKLIEDAGKRVCKPCFLRIGEKLS